MIRAGLRTSATLLILASSCLFACGSSSPSDGGSPGASGANSAAMGGAGNAGAAAAGAAGSASVSGAGGMHAAGGSLGAGGAGSGGSAGLGVAGGSSGSGSSGSNGVGGSLAGSGGHGGASSGGSNSGGSVGASGAGTGGASTGGSSGASTGGAGAGGSGGSGGSVDYHPCPTDGTPCKIMPLGDSITWGVGDEANAGYRSQLFALAVAAQQKITFTGSLSNGPSTVSGQPFPKQNEGHSGWTISMPNSNTGGSGITTLIPTPAFASTSGGIPHIILMMIGTNDTGTFTGAQMATQLSALLDKIIAAAPNTLLVVAKITPVSYASTAVNAYNSAIPGLVQTRASAGKHIAVADMNTGFNSGTMLSSDNLHPNNTGYAFMASRWYGVIGPLLPK